MQIGLLTDLQGQRVWHKWLAAELACDGHELVIVRSSLDSALSRPTSLQIALWLDPVLFKLRDAGERAFAELPEKVLPECSPRDGILDLLIDASSGGTTTVQARRVVRLLFNGRTSELAAVDAILDQAVVVLTIDNGQGVHLETVRPGIERRECLSAALDNVFSAVVEWLADRIKNGNLASAIARPGPAAKEQTASDSRSDPKIGNLAGSQYIASVVKRKVSNYLDRHIRAKMSWAIAIRTCLGKGLAEGPWPSVATYDVIPDDGQRYFADPFLFEHNGRTHLFAEEFPFATGRGIISVAEVDERGNAGTFRPVLERQHHLSYPFVFAEAGEIWMIPEACESGGVDLYRAVEFPGRWEFERTVLDGVPGCDATIVPFGGKYFMILTSTRWRGSTWDKQRIFVAQSPLGPWQEQAGGLVRVDCTLARPAGPPIACGRKILRPAQDCSRFYGGSMTLLEVRHLSASASSEVPVARLRVIAPAEILGTHTYSKSRTIEAIDVFGDVSATRRVTLECAPISAASDAEPTFVPDRREPASDGNHLAGT
jgi:hypothetical protein